MLGFVLFTNVLIIFLLTLVVGFMFKIREDQNYIRSIVEYMYFDAEEPQSEDPQLDESG